MEPLLPALIACALAESGRPALHLAGDVRRADTNWLGLALFIQGLKLAIASFGGAYVFGGLTPDARMSVMGGLLCFTGLYRLFWALARARAETMPERWVRMINAGHPLGDNSQFAIAGVAVASLSPATSLLGGGLGIAFAIAAPLVVYQDYAAIAPWIDRVATGLLLLIGIGVMGSFIG